MDTPRLGRASVRNIPNSTNIKNLKENTPLKMQKNGLRTPFAKTPHFKSILGERTNNQTPKLVPSRAPLPRTGRKKQIEVYKDEELELNLKEKEMEYCPPPVTSRKWEPEDEIDVNEIKMQVPKYLSKAEKEIRAQVELFNEEYEYAVVQDSLEFVTSFEPNLELDFESFLINFN